MLASSSSMPTRKNSDAYRLYTTFMFLCSVNEHCMWQAILLAYGWHCVMSVYMHCQSMHVKQHAKGREDVRPASLTVPDTFSQSLLPMLASPLRTSSDLYTLQAWSDLAC